MNATHPVFTSAEALAFERARFAGDEAAEWVAMQQAGRAVAAAVRRDFGEVGAWPAAPCVRVLAGKGHNAGDALIAAQALLATQPAAQAEVVFAFGERSLRPLAARAWRDLVTAAPGRVRVGRAGKLAPAPAPAADVVLDGVFGFQFRPPLDEATAALLTGVNAAPARWRAAIDLPSGLGDAQAFRADATYATGSVKAPVLEPAHVAHVGRLRYLDLGFFTPPPATDAATTRVLTPEALAPLVAARSAASDKRTYGHLLVVGGSRPYAGAILMAVRAALHSGVGLVTACVPESLTAAYAAAVPEAMWLGWPETPEGSLALEGLHLLRGAGARATALLLGPGLGREAETLALAADIMRQATWPAVLDADALQPEIVRAAQQPLVLTPHAGEYARLDPAGDLAAYARPDRLVIAKGPRTHVADGRQRCYVAAGGPVLARGGSGDLLAGLTAGLLAQTPGEPGVAACRGALWHARAADALARARGATAVSTTALLEFLGEALRDCAEEGGA